MKVADNLYVYLWTDQRENNCNSVVIDGKVPLLIDPGHLPRVSGLLTRMEADGFDPERIRVVICTHAHPDHFEGTRAFQKSSVRIGISRQEEKLVEEIGPSMYMQQGLTMPEYRVDFYLQDGTLNLGKLEFEILLTPGHSPGGICIYWPRHRVLISGDLVFMGSIGRADLPGGDGPTLKASLERISRFPVELLIPGHGPALQGAEEIAENFRFVKKTFFGLM